MYIFPRHVISLWMVLGIWITGIPVQAAQVLDKPVVLVNAVPISAQEVAEREALIKQHVPKEQQLSRADIVKQLIMEEILIQTAARNGTSCDAPEIEQMAESYLQQFGESQPGITNNKQKLKRQLLINALRQDMQRSIMMSPTEEEIQAAMENMPEKLPSAPSVQYHLEVLRVPLPSRSLTTYFKWVEKLAWWRRGRSTVNEQHNSSDTLETIRGQAKTAIAKAKEGSSFKQLAEENKQKPAWKVETIQRTTDKLPPAYAHALKTLRPQEVAGPFQLYNGFHIIRLKEVTGPVAAQARHILLREAGSRDVAQLKKQLVEIRERCLSKASSFEKQAEQYSEDQNTVFKGGDLSWILPDTLEKTFHETLNALEPGQISAPFKTNEGWHIVQLIQKQFLTQEHPEWRRYIAKLLAQQRKSLEVMQKMSEELYASAHIQWLDATLQADVESKRHSDKAPI
jgi:parvulin-like peptidyl-prolyl isomerase